MIVVTTAKIYGDEHGRLFCKGYRVVPNTYFKESDLRPFEYAYAAKDVPKEFWAKCTLYYVDETNNNRLTFAYEYEHTYLSQTFKESDVIGINGKLSDSALIQTLQLAVKDLSKKLIDYDDVKARLESATVQIELLKARIAQIEAALDSGP